MKKVLVTEAERRRIADEGSVLMGSKVTQRVIDLEKVANWLKEDRKNKNLSPYIEIQPISADLYKNPHKQATYQKDPLTGVLYGIALSADEFGNIRWQKIQINESLSLNLDNNNDAKIWAVIRFNPDILGSPFQRENPYFKVYDPVDEAIAEQNEILLMEKAFDRIRMLIKDPVAMVRFARYLGEEVRDNTNYDIVHGSLLRMARHHPAEFNKRWETKARSYAENFYSALALGLITEDANTGYSYKNITLGLSRADAVKSLAKDATIMSALISDLQENDVAVRNVEISMKQKPAKKEVEEEEKKEEDFEE